MEYVAIAFVFILAGIVPELTGFGAATVSMVFLPFLLPLQVAIPLVAMTSVITTGIVSFQTRTKGLWGDIFSITIGSVIGVPLGMMFLHYVDTDILQLSLALFLIFYALYGFFIKHAPLHPNKYIAGFIGAISGFFSAIFNIHGPLVGAYTSSHDTLSIHDAKSIIATHMCISGIFTVIGHGISGRITPLMLIYLLYVLPFLFAGMYIGTKAFGKLHGDVVRKIIYTFVLCAGVLLLAQ